MASVDWEKCKGAGSTKAKMRHNDTGERLKHNHSNPDIDKTKTSTNVNLLGLSYAESCAAYDEKIAELDSKDGANKRKDRVTAISLEFKVPVGLPEELEAEWARKALDEIQKVLGDIPLISAYLHRDEKHEYYDPEKGEKVMSRTHIHAIYIPEVDGRLYARGIATKANIIAVNNAVHEMTKSDYHLDFMDGTKKKRKKTVETLKNESEQAELDALRKQYKTAMNGLKKRENELDAREIELDEKMSQMQAKITEKQKVLDNLTDEITEKQSVLSDLLVQIATMIKDSQRRMRTNYNKPSPEEQKEIVAEITKKIQQIDSDFDFDLDF
jgi:hypothetical protein